MKEMEIIQSLVFWGPGAVIAGVIIFALYRLTKTIGLEFVKAQQAQASALAQQALSMEGLRESIHGFVSRENGEHREMIILLKVVTDYTRKNGDRIERIEKRCHISGACNDQYRNRTRQTG